MAQIAHLFRTDAKTIPKRLRGMVGAGRNRRGHAVYDIAEAATYLVRPGYEIEEYIRQMSPQELPPLLSKEYWNGLNARLKYEKEMGNLWPTEQVVEAFGTGLAALRMSILLMQDAVEREHSLSQAQRDAMQRIMDGAVNDCREAIEEKMKEFDSAYQLGDDGDIQQLDRARDGESDDGNILAAPRDEEEDIGI